MNFKQISAGYSTLLAICQQPFDDFGWQNFVALNWPLTDLSTPRPWEKYEDPAAIFDKSAFATMTREVAAAGAAAGQKILYRMAKSSTLPGGHPTPFLEATGQPLIDRNLNFTLYEVRINPVWVNYVVNTAKLATLKEQQAFVAAGHMVNFPAGSYKDDVKGTGGSLGAMEVKAAWRILDPSKGDKPERFYTRRATIYISGENTVSGKPLIIRDALVGLVGLHINVMTSDGKGSVWPSFEHEDNAPAQGASPGGKTYSYFNADCTACKPNVPPTPVNGEKNFKWAMTAPYAQRYAVDGKYGTQVTIVQPVFSETGNANQRWRAKLGNSVWTHYRLVGTQWVNHESRMPAGIPPLLGNGVLETYIQTTSTCIVCHSSATLAASSKASADFSFLLGHAH
ncbi:MAG: hypothetical protein LAO79_12440 [Acidobacteriia bacterium]|nr:hypothetical protein [Terriglobia bacterium]